MLVGGALKSLCSGVSSRSMGQPDSPGTNPSPPSCFAHKNGGLVFLAGVSISVNFERECSG